MTLILWTALMAAHGAVAPPEATTEVVPSAEQDEASRPDGQDSGTIIVTATRAGTLLEDLPLSASIIDEAEVRQQLEYSSNILRAVEFSVPGLSPQGEGRSGCFVGVRGRQTSIQINGTPVNQDLRQSNCNAMFQISPFAVERIEVVRGGTALFGAGAPGGIINFITRRAKSAKLEIDAVAQTSFNTSDWDKSFSHDLYLGGGQDLGPWDYYVGAAYTDTGARRTPDGGFVPFRAYESLALNGSIGVDLMGGELRATGTFYRETPDQEYGSDGTQVLGQSFANIVPIAGHPQLDESSDRLSTMALSYSHPAVLGQELHLSLFSQDQRYLQRDNFYDLEFGDFFFATNTDNERVGVRSALVKRFAVGAFPASLTYGFDYTRNRFYRPTVDPAAGGAIIGFISPEVILNTYAVFAQAELDFGRLKLTGGARQEWYRGRVGDEGFDAGLGGAGVPGDFGKSDLALFNLGAVFDLAPGIDVFAGFSQGAELSQLGRAARNIDDPSLITPEPATSDQFEAGVRGEAGPARFEISAFYSTSDSAAELQSDPSCVGEPLCPLIPLRAPQRFYGFEGAADVRLGPTLDARAVVTWQRGRLFDEDLDEYIDYSTDIVAPFRMTGAFDWRPTERLRASLQGTYYGAADYFTATEESAGRVATRSQFLLDGSLGYRIGPGELFVAGSNLLDDDYVNVQNQGFGSGFFYYQAEGRRVTMGYKARF